LLTTSVISATLAAGPDTWACNLERSCQGKQTSRSFGTFTICFLTASEP
jgi:hypothetical protein